MVCMILGGLVWFSIVYANVFPCVVSNGLVWLCIVLYGLMQLCTIFVFVRQRQLNHYNIRVLRGKDNRTHHATLISKKEDDQ